MLVSGRNSKQHRRKATTDVLSIICKHNQTKVVKLVACTVRRTGTCAAITFHSSRRVIATSGNLKPAFPKMRSYLKTLRYNSGYAVEPSGLALVESGDAALARCQVY